MLSTRDRNGHPFPSWGFRGGSVGKVSAYRAGDPGSIPGQEGPLGKGMATHSSVLAWRIPWTEDLAGYSLRGHRGSDTTERLHGSSVGSEGKQSVELLLPGLYGYHFLCRP